MSNSAQATHHQQNGGYTQNQDLGFDIQKGGYEN